MKQFSCKAEKRVFHKNLEYIAETYISSVARIIGRNLVGFRRDRLKVRMLYWTIEALFIVHCSESILYVK